MAPRPTVDLRDAIIDTFDSVWTQFTARLDGLSADEYLWEPAAVCWNVRLGDDGVARVEGYGEGEIDPAPVTTIAWRIQHLAVDCLDSYSERAFGSTGASTTGDGWHLDPAPATADLEAAWRVFREGAAERSIDEWWQVLGPHWGPYADHSLLDLVLHALHEVTHHTAEIALLRDLYRVRTA